MDWETREGQKKPPNNQHGQFDCVKCSKVADQSRSPLLSHMARAAGGLGCCPEELNAARTLSKADHTSQFATWRHRRELPTIPWANGEGCKSCWEGRRSQTHVNDDSRITAAAPAARQRGDRERQGARRVSGQTRLQDWSRPEDRTSFRAVHPVWNNQWPVKSTPRAEGPLLHNLNKSNI